jgi:hypothetical protein
VVVSPPEPESLAPVVPPNQQSTSTPATSRGNLLRKGHSHPPDILRENGDDQRGGLLTITPFGRSETKKESLASNLEESIPQRLPSPRVREPFKPRNLPVG